MSIPRTASATKRSNQKPGTTRSGATQANMMTCEHGAIISELMIALDVAFPHGVSPHKGQSDVRLPS